jgi:hypothetical protein
MTVMNHTLRSPVRSPCLFPSPHGEWKRCLLALSSAVALGVIGKGRKESRADSLVAT